MQRIASVNHLKYLVISVFILININNSYGQQKELQFKNLSTDDGLSNSQVICILQDYKGFMWFGTYLGLNRFDGSNFTIYKNIPSDSTSLLENHVVAMIEDHNKNLLLGTYSGLSIYDRALDRFINYRYDKKSALYKLSFAITKIAEDSFGNLWLATYEGLIYFDRIHNKIIRYKHDPNNPASLSNNNVNCVYIDKSSRVWVSTDKGLNLFNSKTGEFEHIIHCKSHNDNISQTLFQNTSLEDNEGNIWFGSYDGLFCLEKHDSNFQKELVHFKNSPVDPNSISINYIKSLFTDDENNLWIGTENGGINIFNNNKKIFSQIRIDEFNPNSLNNESIWSIIQDRNKNIWIGTFGGGINFYTKNSNLFYHYKNLPGAFESLGHNIVKEFLEDSHGKIWVATDGGGLNQFNEKTKKFTRYNTSNSNISSNAVLCMSEGDENQIWIGTWAGGLVNFNSKTKTFKSFTTQNSNISDNNIISIAKDKKGNIWIGNQNGGLSYFNVKENKFDVYLPENSKISNKRVSLIEMDNSGNLYLGVTVNMQVFIPSEKRFITYSNNPLDTNSISSNTIYDILFQNDTSVWIATENGLNRFNPVNQKFKRYYNKDGLPNNLILGLTFDKTGILWVTTNNGISRFDYKNNKFKNFFKSDGLQSNEFTARSILTTRSGTILAGGKNGFNIINPRNIPENKKIPDVLITDFHIFNQPVPIGTIGSPLKNQISETSEITLNYTQSVLTFYFAVMDFTSPSKNKYAYKLENFDKDWTYCGNRREATYTNLSPGKYILHVKGSNNDGVWNEVGTVLEITITPPWWKSKFARISFSLLIISLLLGFYLYRVNLLQKQKELLEKLVDERTLELVKTNEIVNEANILLKEKQLEIVHKNAILMRQAEELNDTNSQLEERQMQIEEQQEELLAQKEELKHQRDNLDELNNTKDKLFSILGHDLRSPFNSILGYSDLLYNNFRKYSAEKIEAQIGYIKDTARSTFYLLNNLLEWSRSQQGTIHLELGEIRVSELIKSDFRILDQQANRKGIKLELSTIGTEPIIKADPNILGTIIRNLISNAIKFSNKDNSVFVILKFENDQFTFSVKDQGVGMSAEKIETLFNATKNESTRGTSGEKGTGLGLLLCADFIAKHNGKIWVESEEGKGSTFFFTISANQKSV